MIRLSTATADFEAGFAALLFQARETTETVDRIVADHYESRIDPWKEPSDD